MIAMLFAIGGVVAGTTEAVLLRRSVLRGATPFGVLGRFALVGGLLTAAALAGVLAAAALGWVTGFGVAVGFLAWRWS